MMLSSLALSLLLFFRPKTLSGKLSKATRVVSEANGLGGGEEVNDIKVQLVPDKSLF